MNRIRSFFVSVWKLIIKVCRSTWRQPWIRKLATHLIALIIAILFASHFFSFTLNFNKLGFISSFIGGYGVGMVVIPKVWNLRGNAKFISLFFTAAIGATVTQNTFKFGITNPGSSDLYLKGLITGWAFHYVVNSLSSNTTSSTPKKRKKKPTN